MLRRTQRILFALSWLFLLPVTVNAQTAAYAILTTPDTVNFPRISAYLDVFDGTGNFVHDLVPQDITIIEDGKSVAIDALEKIESGTQFVVAFNLGPTFAIRDVNGISRLDVMRETLTNWANSHTNPQDDLSFLTNDGPEFTHLPNARQWLTGLDSYTTDPRTAIPSLDVLVRAIDVASDPAPRVGMGKAVLLLTPPPDRAGAATLQSILSLARQENVRIFVWMVSSPAYFQSEGAKQLAELADQTGGEFLGYAGEEEIPSIENYITPLGYVYTLSYESKIRNSEPHQIAVNIRKGNIRINSEPVNFNLEVAPPNPIFIAPPLQIFRANRAALGEALSEETDYTPKNQELEILIEFPDRRERPLVRSTLYVDDQIADENTTPPFDKFTWNLEEYTNSGEHTLKVEVLDSYGLSGISIEHSVQVTIQQTPQNIVSTIAQNAPVIASFAAAIAGGILILVLIIGGRIKPRTFGRRRRQRKSIENGRANNKDPLTQPVQLKPLPSRQRFSSWINRLHWPSRTTGAAKPFAYLETLSEANGKSMENQIPIPFGEISIGTDPNLVTSVINDGSVDPCHARIRAHNESGIYLYDQGSSAGIWVNYEPVLSGGVKLVHGDIIHIGIVGLRLKFNDKEYIPKPIVIPKELDK